MDQLANDLRFVAHVDGLTFRKELEVEPIKSWLASEPDPDWRHKDSHGHEHRLVDGEWPTLRWVTYNTTEPADGHWECATCGEEVVPGMRLPGGESRRYRYFINDEPVSEEEFQRVGAEWMEKASAEDRH